MHSRDITILIVLATVVCSLYDCALLQLVSILYQSTTLVEFVNVFANNNIAW